MEAAVIELNRNIQNGEACQWTLFHHDLEALLNGWEKFLRYVSANNTRSEDIAITGLSGCDAVVDLTELT